VEDAERSAETETPVILITKVTGLSGGTLQERIDELTGRDTDVRPSAPRVPVAAFNASL
jgi:hypothetical protein